MILDVSPWHLVRCLALLQLNTTLRRLDLSGNAIDRTGTEAIADALKGNSALESLQIKYASCCLRFYLRGILRVRPQNPKHIGMPIFFHKTVILCSSIGCHWFNP